MGRIGLVGAGAGAGRHPENPIILAILLLTISRRGNGQRWLGPVSQHRDGISVTQSEG